ncbi:reverse transcriptase [Gossypium australe]|uniref:Reverse transcriptase n=1 Tax=Gossypium australe TaxID=47621 RepID=A0A5B6VCZ9_9ROSI|nr:reverse transcriptase [Gossypium australe]
MNSKRVPTVGVANELNFNLTIRLDEGMLANVMSAIQFANEVHSDEVSYLGTLKFDEFIESIGEILKEMDVILPELPKKLPPKRESLVLFNRKHDGFLRICINYRTLNNITVKNKYPIPHLADLFDQFSSTRWFTKLDLRLGYHQVRVVEGDEPKMTYVTRYDLYEFLFMSFGLTNALVTFCTLMNKVLQPFLDHFMVVYIDNIVVYNKLVEEHVEYFREVFQAL